MARLVDTVENLIATLVVALVAFQIVAVLLEQLGVFEALGYTNNVKLGFAFILLAGAASVIGSFMLIVNKRFELTSTNTFGIVIVTLGFFSTILFLPRLVPQIFDQQTLDGLRGVGLLSAAPFELPAQAGFVVGAFNGVVAFLTPFVTLLLLLALAVFVHFKVRKTSRWKAFAMGAVFVAYVLVSSTTAFTSSFGGAT